MDDLVNGKIVKNTYYFNNYKASVFRQSKNERYVAIYINDKNTGTDTQVFSFIPVSYDKKHNDKSEDELIEDYLENTRKQNKDITINVIQKTWDNEAPPIERDYGGSSNIYYLNNGSTIQINWTSTQLSGETNAHEFIGVTVSYPYSLFEETIFGPNQPVGGKRWSNNGKELEIPNDTPKLQNYTTFFPTTTTASVPYGSKNFDLETGIPIDEDGFFGFAANAKQVKNHVISKRIVIQEPSDIGNSEPILILDDGTFKKSSEVEGSIIAAGASGGSASNILVEKVYPGGVTDLQIIKQVRDNWVKSAEPYGELDVCNPNNEFCRIIDYKSPLSDDPTPEDEIPISDNPPTGTQSVDLSVVLPEDLDAIVRTDIGTIKIYIGEPFDPFVDAFVFKSDGFDDSDLLQGELERNFEGSEFGGEQIFSEEEYDKIAQEEEENPSSQGEIVNPDNTPGASTGLKATGNYTCELPKESNKNSKGYKIAYGYNGVPYYGQYDGRWNNVIYGLSNEGVFVETAIPKKGNSKGVNKVDWNGKTYNVNCDWSNGITGFSSIQGGGCGITSMSMIINYWMIKLKTGKYTSPIKMAKMACENGARSKKPPCNGTSPTKDLFNKVFEIYGIKMTYSNKSEAEKLVKQGIPVMFCGQKFYGRRGNGEKTGIYDGHFVVITGYDNGKFRVNDPGASGGIAYFDTIQELAKGGNGTGGFWKFGPADVIS